MVYIVTIMGNIGSGKSTLMRRLEEQGYFVIQEPINQWVKWLDCFYKNPAAYAYSFQMKVLFDFHMLIKKYHENDILIIERSPLESKEIFATTLVKDNLMNELEYELLLNYHDEFAWKPNSIIYLKSNPDVCLQRIKTRSRDCECDIELSYLQKLHDNYTSFVDKNKDIKCSVIDANKNEDSVFHEVNDILAKIS